MGSSGGVCGYYSKILRGISEYQVKGGCAVDLGKMEYEGISC